jgi:peptidoglycan/LPS O-acetylase OafA/YrhL
MPKSVPVSTRESITLNAAPKRRQQEEIGVNEKPQQIETQWSPTSAWAWDAKSVGEILDANKGVGPGFDFLRLFLSVAVVVDHCYQNFLGDRASAFLVKPTIYTILGVFFALSGFLVTGSAMRTKSVPTFLSFRILRLVPALAVETVLSALVIGPLVTSLPLHDYFTSRSFFTYFGNIAGHVQTTLPGVFTQHGETDGFVNVNLWTLKPEFACYAVMTVLMLTASLTKIRTVVLSLAFLAVILVLSFFDIYDPINEHLRWHLLLYAFVLGSMAYIHRYSIPVHAGACIVSFIVAVLLLQPENHRLAPLAVPFLVYVTVCLGMFRLPMLNVLKRGDYSYGIYLYGYPVTGMLCYFVPAVMTAWLLPPVAVLCTLAFAAASWHFIEKPALGLRKKLFKQTKIIVHS